VEKGTRISPHQDKGYERYEGAEVHRGLHMRARWRPPRKPYGAWREAVENGPRVIGGKGGRLAREGGVVRDFRKNAGAEFGTRK
jgi:hypothetical protein